MYIEINFENSSESLISSISREIRIGQQNLLTEREHKKIYRMYIYVCAAFTAH